MKNEDFNPDDPGFKEDYMHEGSTHGHVTINISGGTIGNNYEYIMPTDANITASGIAENDVSKWEAATWTTWKNHHNIPNTEFVYDKDLNIYRLSHTKGGNVFAGAMGRMYALDNKTALNRWKDLGKVKTTKLTISGGTIKSNVYGGGELGWTAGKREIDDEKKDSISTEIRITNCNIGSEIKDDEGNVISTFGSVYGGGYGSRIEELSDGTNPKFIAGRVVGSTKVDIQDGTILGSVYGGGETANVGYGFHKFTGETPLVDKDNNPLIPIGNVSTYVNISGGTIGSPGLGGASMGNVYGGGSGFADIVRCGLVLGNTNVNISQPEGKTTSIYHSVYGGGAYGSVGDFDYQTEAEPCRLASNGYQGQGH